MFTNFFRVFKFGWQELSRNIGISLGTIFIMFIALSLITAILFSREMTKNLIISLEEKVDISVYFKKEAEENALMTVKEKIENFPEVKEVEYVSREKALENFKERYKDTPWAMEALEMIGDNPLSASLNIRANDSLSYANLANFLENGEFKDIVDKVNWRQNRAIIEKLFSISSNIEKGGIVISSVLICIVLVVIFNTVRLAIYSKKEEIETMKLIGATNWFARGPFLVQGLFIGLLGGILSFLFFYVVNSAFSPDSFGIFGELGFFTFFRTNILEILSIQILGGVVLGVFSSFLACQKYLKV